MERTKALFILLVLALLLSSSVFSQEKAQESMFKDGFLFKEYSVRQDNLVKALNAMCAKANWMPYVDQKLKQEKGMYKIWAVGDKNGIWMPKSKSATVRGVGTIKELNVKKGGTNIEIKSINKNGNILVGFKIGDGDQAFSEVLHHQLTDKLRQ